MRRGECPPPQPKDRGVGGGGRPSFKPNCFWISMNQIFIEIFYNHKIHFGCNVDRIFYILCIRVYCEIDIGNYPFEVVSKIQNFSPLTTVTKLCQNSLKHFKLLCFVSSSVFNWFYFYIEQYRAWDFVANFCFCTFLV